VVVVTTLNTDTVLITGGSDGIGLALAKRFLAKGATVIVTGRSADKLRSAAEEAPGLLTLVSDVGQPAEREKLAQHIRDNHPGINIVLNNAGIQRRVSLAADQASWQERQTEIDVLFGGPVHLNSLLVPILLAHGKQGLIVNVTSGGAYFPQPFAPIYSASKAALHSYTVNLRFALSDTTIRVVELAPPAVKTGLMAAGVSHGADLNEFADKVFGELFSGAQIVGFGPTDTAQFHSLIATTDELFESIAGRFPVQKYKSKEA
jgi:uncharacterized oxidoreductase